MSLETKGQTIWESVSDMPQDRLVSDRWIVSSLRKQALDNMYTDEDPYFQINGLSFSQQYHESCLSMAIDPNVPLIEVVRDFSNVLRFMGLPVLVGGREDLEVDAINMEANIAAYTDAVGDFPEEFKEEMGKRINFYLNSEEMDIVEDIDYADAWTDASNAISAQEKFFSLDREGVFIRIKAKDGDFCEIKKSLILKAYGLHLVDRQTLSTSSGESLPSHEQGGE